MGSTLLVGEADVADSDALEGGFVSDDPHVDDLADVLEVLPQFLLSDLQMQVAHEDGGLVVEVVVETEEDPQGVLFNFGAVDLAGLLGRLLLSEFDVAVHGVGSFLQVFEDEIGLLAQFVLFNRH